jgi:hypothetical protein
MKATLLLKHKPAIDVKVLVDSGSTGSCIHRRLVEEYNLPTKTLPRPIPVYNADGTLNQDGDIKETVTIQILAKLTYSLASNGSNITTHLSTGLNHVLPWTVVHTLVNT